MTTPRASSRRDCGEPVTDGLTPSLLVAGQLPQRGVERVEHM